VAKEVRFQMGKDKIRKRLIKYTREAFRLIPRMEKPRILDIGCGSGVPTLELARLSRGEVIGIDIDQPALDKFAAKIAESGLSDRAKALNCSLINMDFPEETFDIIWVGRLHIRHRFRERAQGMETVSKTRWFYGYTRRAG
jgi:ubiquinone/menaquinone biosynthesis C-methylase UbiE